MDRAERAIERFWNTHPCGEHVAASRFADDYARFFAEYDSHRYREPAPHHVPEIRSASAQIARMLRPDGELIVVMYARWSWHYLGSIALYSRLTQAAAYLLGKRTGDVLGGGYADVIDRIGLAHYLRLRTFTHHNTDGPLNPYTKMYDLQRIRADFPEFDVTRAYKRLSPPAPWLLGVRPPLERMLGWYLWVHLRPRS
jgi:SAM-dependent methyltransferase